MALLMTRIQVDDYDAWKPMVDADRAGARKRAKGHRIARNVDNPDEVFVQFSSRPLTRPRPPGKGSCPRAFWIG